MQITGLETNVNFLLDLARHPSFRAADVHTGFIDQHMATLFPPLHVSDTVLCQSAVSVLLHEQQLAGAAATGTPCNPFVVERNFRVNHAAERAIRVRFDGTEHVISVRQVAAGSDGGDGGELLVRVNPTGAWLPVRATRVPHAGRLTIKCAIDGVFSTFSAVVAPDGLAIFNDGGKTELQLAEPSYVALLRGDGAGVSAASQVSWWCGCPRLRGINLVSRVFVQVVSPMPGVLDKMLVQPGDRVRAGEPVAVIIAMKMEHVLKAPRDGIVERVAGEAGTNVAKGAAVVTFVEETAAESAAEAVDRQLATAKA